MACAICKRRMKRGMGGSRCGRDRSEYTEIMKKDSKKARRREGSQFIDESLNYKVEHWYK